jgi:hypothetical protein
MPPEVETIWATFLWCSLITFCAVWAIRTARAPK